MPAAFAFLWTLLKNVLMSVFGRIVIFFGLEFVTFHGLDSLVGNALNAAQSQFLSMPTSALSLLGLAGFDRALNIIVSAMVVKLTLKLINRPNLTFKPF